MKKRKTYEISVIDRTYSKTISDETKFYTSDTALELVFKLKETEYTFESAEIVLLNTNDKSLITRRVVKSDEGFVYTFEKDIIAHYGEWKAQLMFIENVDAHVASPIKFRIENDLYNTKPQALSDVVSWVNLKLYAEKLVGEFKQVVDTAIAKSVEMENTFKASENARQSQFETAEQSRQTTFETSESGRNETFIANESTRQTQELEREKAEGQRQTVFDRNEANRTETFNTNEATRKANEEARELAEYERENAEAQRKTDHANRSAELAGKADKVAINNLVVNGDFSNGATGWTASSSIEIDNNTIHIKSDNTASHSIWQDIASVGSNDKFYVTLDLNLISNPENRSVITTIRDYGTVTTISTKQANIQIMNQYQSLSTIVSSPNGIRLTPVYITNPRYEARITNIMAINLTETFGAGNEPTKEEMDRLIEITGYIDGEYALNNKEMLIWTLALIRRNKNAIITLGGTI